MSKWTWLRNIRNSKDYFNIDDFNNGNKFLVVDNVTNKVFSLCKKETSDNKYLDIPDELQCEEFIKWLIDYNYEVFFYLEKKNITIEIIRYTLNKTVNLPNNTREEVFKKITFDEWVSVITKYPATYMIIPQKYITKNLESIYKKISNDNRLNDTTTTKALNQLSKNKKDIKLNTILGFFKNEEIIKVLSNNGINTLREFLIKLNNKSNEEKISHILSNSYSNYMDFKATVSLLRCKYLKIDPQIKVYDIDLITLLNILGLSNDIGTKLYEMGYSYDYKNFIIDMAEMSIDERINYFSSKSSMSNVEIEQLVYRLEIVIDFYKVRHKVLVNRLSPNKGK